MKYGRQIACEQRLQNFFVSVSGVTQLYSKACNESNLEYGIHKQTR